MSEFEERIDPFTGTPILLAPGRRRIGAARPPGLPVPDGRCPFCPGHEPDTERTVLSIGEPWRVRVVSNRFPLFDQEAHDVLIESRDHDADLSRYDDGAIREVLLAMRERVRVHEARGGVRAVATFRNRGRRAGSSQPHPHAQIVALPFVPPGVAVRDAIAAKEPGLLARVLDEERALGARVVRESGDWIAFCPFAPGRPFEVRLASRAPIPRFAETSDAALEVLGPLLRDVCAAMLGASGVSDYNLLVRDPAIGAGAFFTIDLLPRSGGDAGFELLTATPIVTVAPELAAREIRALLPAAPAER